MRGGINMRGIQAVGMGDFWSDLRDKVLGADGKTALQTATATAITGAVKTATQPGTVSTTSPAGGVMTVTSTAPAPASSGGVIDWIKENPLPATFIGLGIFVGIAALRK